MLAIGGAVLALAFRSTVDREFSLRLDAMLRAMIAATEIGADGSMAAVRSLGDPRFDQVFSGWYWQVTENNGRQVRSRSMWDSVITPSGDRKELHTRRTTGPNGEPLLVVERNVEFPDTAGPVNLLVAGDLREVNDGVQRFDFLLAGSLGLMGIGMAIAVLLQVRFGLQPLRAMAADLQAVHEGARPRLSGRYPREVAPLAKSMNEVLDKDVELIERARTHVGNLAHGLKTSLAIVAAELGSGADREVLGQQIRVMRRLIEHHLARASAVAGAGRVARVSVLVNEIAEDVTNAMAKVYFDRRLSIEVDVAADVGFPGHREDLEEIIGNLAENACKWARGHVRVSARRIAHRLVLSVEDDGPGMPPEQKAQAARRGKRLDEMAPGWGLGLSIVSDLVEVYGGELTFLRSRMGGLLVEASFPK